MRTVYILLYLSILFVQLNAQQLPIQDYKRDHKWGMGYPSLPNGTNGRFHPYQFNFNELPFTFDSLNTRIFGFFLTNLSICDADGNILFYSNGVRISNAYADSINGTSNRMDGGIFASSQEFSGGGVPQGGVMLPRPNDTNLVDLFHVRLDYVYQPGGIGSVCGTDIFHTLLDRRLNSGRGGLVFVNRPYMQDTFGNKMTACRHANGRDWWFVNTKYFSNQYFVSLLGPNGPELKDTVVVGAPFFAGGGGPAEFSRDGKNLIVYDFDKIRVFDFDRCEGRLSGYREVNTPFDSASLSRWGNFSLGGAFSPDSRYYYFGGCAKFFRLELATLAIDSLDVWDGYRDTTGNSWGGLGFPTNPSEYRIGPDGRIYVVTQSSTTYMHIIEQPNLSSPRVRQRGIRLPTYSFSAPPQHPELSAWRRGRH